MLVEPVNGVDPGSLHHSIAPNGPLINSPHIQIVRLPAFGNTLAAVGRNLFLHVEIVGKILGVRGGRRPALDASAWTWVESLSPFDIDTQTAQTLYLLADQKRRQCIRWRGNQLTPCRRA